MRELLIVFLGGGLGSVGRYGVGRFVAASSDGAPARGSWLSMMPVSTLVVNLVGCALIGLLWAWAHHHERDAASGWMLLMVVGVLGGFTTFSSFGYETFELLREGRTGHAIGYALGSVVLGLVCVWIAYGAGGLLLRGGSPA
jgi:CrcB protein